MIFCKQHTSTINVNAQILARLRLHWLVLLTAVSWAQAATDVAVHFLVPQTNEIGQRLTYVLIVSNTVGPATATGVVVTNHVPDALSISEVLVCQGQFCYPIYLTNHFVRHE